MSDQILIMGGVKVLVLTAQGPLLAHERDTGAFVSAAWEAGADLVALPVSRLGDDFLHLSTRLAGDVIQKFVNYRLRLAILGDISDSVARSEALRDFVRESNRGRAVWFLDDLDSLRSRLENDVA